MHTNKYDDLIFVLIHNINKIVVFLLNPIIANRFPIGLRPKMSKITTPFIYIFICWNDYYATFYSKFYICLQLLCIWVIPFLAMVLPLLEIWGKLGFNPLSLSCTILENYEKSPKKTFFILGVALPCLMIIIAYSCIYWTVRNSKIRLRSHETLTKTTSKKKHDDNKLTSLMILIFFCFLLCFMPFVLVKVFDDKVSYPELHIFSSLLVWASAVINPFIYVATNKQYRNAYKKLFGKVGSI
ncbi:hypothetical protein ABEB36_015803 [Hypothenemus hampei]|uniref:G-protein coupled receptors family 1 profile domain-containing protein n=1 Tax=Hypothenemus hampei TaxID=57062 RepID=A0ABD1DYR1_HYPHA